MTTTTKNTKKPAGSSKDYDVSDKKIVEMKKGNSYSMITRKTKEELAKEIEEKKEKTAAQQENIQKFGKVLFLNLKDALDNSKTANNYLFAIIKDVIESNKAYRGLYKIDVIKKDEKGIICRIVGTNYKKEIIISNEKIMQKKPKEDTLEKGFSITKTYYKDGKKQETTRQGKTEDFLDEIQYGDSVIIDVQNDSIRKIYPDNIIEEIRKYIKSNDNNDTRNKKIQTAMKFFNESTEQNSSEYIQEFFKIVRRKESQRNKGQPTNKIENYKEHFAKVLKRFFNIQPLYVHKGNDIDKSAVKFLLEKFGIKADKIFKEIEHSDVEKIHSGVFLDVGVTANGIKIIQKPIAGTKKGKETKTILSEHKDTSDEALLANRPSSTTQIIFKIFKELGAIDKEQLPQIQRFVNFVNTVDAMDYQISGIDYKHNYETLFGLYRTMDIKDVFDYFQDPNHNGFEKLPERYMKKTKTIINTGERNNKKLQETSEKNKERININIEKFEKMKDAGKELEYNGEKFIVDIEEKIENQLQYGPQTAGYYGYGFFNIKPERGNLYIYSPKKFPAMIEGFTTDGHFLIINNPTVEDLEKLFEKFTTEDTKLKNNIINRLKTIQNKNAEPATKEEIITRCKMLPELTKKDFKVGKTYSAVIHDDIQGKIAYLTLDKKGMFKSRVKAQDKNELKKYKKGDIIKVRIDEISEDESKLFTLSLA